MAPKHKTGKGGKGKERAEPKTEAVVPFGKQLAHTDKAVRDQAVRNLTAFLSAGGEGEEEASGYTRLEDKEMAKLWKGLFYCESCCGRGGRTWRRHPAAPDNARSGTWLCVSC
jgi:ribosomal RNA-processing protein 1